MADRHDRRRAASVISMNDQTRSGRRSPGTCRLRTIASKVSEAPGP
jgi:hypothetical protein